MRFLFLVCGFLTFITAASSVRAAAPTDAELAKALFISGKDAMARGDLPTSCGRFGESLKLDQAVGTLLNLATCEERSGKLAIALQHFKAARAQLAKDDFRVPFANERIASLSQRVAHIIVRLGAPRASGTRVLRDGGELDASSFDVPIAVDPGPHVLVVESTTRPTERVSFTVVEGEEKIIELVTSEKDTPENVGAASAKSLPPPPRDASIEVPPDRDRGSTRRTLAFVTAGLAVAGLATGTVTGLMTVSAASTYRDHCNDGACDPEGLAAAATGRTVRIVSPVAFAIGGAAGDLRTTDSSGTALPRASAGFLQYRSGDDVESLVSDAATLVRGVGETGCGLEAQLEAMYRFFVQPDPWKSIFLDDNMLADLGSTVDYKVLEQRKAFLRPDSALVVVMLTDEDDSSVDPLSVNGQGWAFMAKNFPGSKVFRGAQGHGTTAPRGTSICTIDPGSPDCTSCGFQSLCGPSEPSCQKLKSDPNCMTSGYPGQSGEGYDGYYGPTDDELNVRFHRMRERFGVDPQYPIARYVDGFTRFKVPDRNGEHTTVESGSHRKISEYKGTHNCTNPIFAASLPDKAGDELCDLPPGTRSRELVVFALLGGVPESLVSGSPNWRAILGANPDEFDFSGIDPHMIQSVAPRAGLGGADEPRGSNGGDPVHGREWITGKADLQYACTFALPEPRTCTWSDPSCDCPPDMTTNPPLCSTSEAQQIRAKAYPTPRPLRVAKGLGERAIIGSICAGAGYDQTMQTLASRLKPRLAL